MSILLIPRNREKVRADCFYCVFGYDGCQKYSKNNQHEQYLPFQEWGSPFLEWENLFVLIVFTVKVRADLSVMYYEPDSFCHEKIYASVSEGKDDRLRRQ